MIKILVMYGSIENKKKLNLKKIIAVYKLKH